MLIATLFIVSMYKKKTYDDKGILKLNSNNILLIEINERNLRKNGKLYEYGDVGNHY